MPEDTQYLKRDVVIRNSFAVWAVVEGIDIPVDISSGSITYAVNSIPTATNLQIMIGVNLLEASDGPEITAKLKQHKKIDIRFAVLNDDANKGAAAIGVTHPKKAYVDAFPPAITSGIVIFRGTITSVMFSRSTSVAGNSFSYSISASNFLSALAGTPTTSKTFAQAPRNDPDRFMRFMGSDFTSAPKGSVFSGATMADAYLKQFPKIYADVWKNGIRNMLYSVASTLNDDRALDILLSKTLSGVGADNENTKDNSVCNPAWMSSDGNDTISFERKGKPDANSWFSQSLIQGIERQVYNGMLAQNAFSSIVGAANEFNLALIPTIEAYAVVPFSLGLRGAPFRKIYADEIEAIKETYAPRAPLRRIVLRATSGSNPTLYGGISNNSTSIKGEYPPAGESPLDADGLVAETKFIDIPSWLSTAASLRPYKIGGIPNSEREPSTRIESNYDNLGLLGAYAKSAYFNEIFGDSSLSIVGRVRFDIGPGSLVEVESPGPVDESGITSIASIFGVVSSVNFSFSVNGSSGTANTSYNIVATRSKEDHEDTTNTSTTHPLYNTEWRGTPLMQEYGIAREPQ